MAVGRTTLHNLDFAEFARICGAHGSRVDDHFQQSSAIADVLTYPGPTLVELMGDPDLV